MLVVPVKAKLVSVPLAGPVVTESVNVVPPVAKTLKL